MPANAYLNTFAGYINEHPQFSVNELDQQANKLSFTTYKYHHPLNTPTDAFRALIRDTAKITWSHEHDQFNIAQYTFRRGYPTLPADITEIKLEFPDILNDLAAELDLRHLRRFRGSNGRIPRSTQTALHEEFGSYYNALNTTPDELRKIDGMGDARIDHFYDPDKTPRGKPKWAALTHCPSCNERFWSVFPAPTNSRRTPHTPTIQDHTYCPACNHNTIPASHILDPVEFTDDNIIQQQPTPTTT